MESDPVKLLTSLFLKYSSLTNSSLDKLSGACEIVQMKKGERISSIGKPDAYEYFLLDHLAFRYVFEESGEMVTTGFYLSGTAITPHFARTVNGKSIYNLEALTAGNLAKMPVKILDSLRNSYEDIRTFGLKVVERELIHSLHTEVAYRSLNAKDRLEAFRTQYPNLENLVPHTLIASYLGVTPVSFSRLRSELVRR